MQGRGGQVAPLGGAIGHGLGQSSWVDVVHQMSVALRGDQEESVLGCGRVGGHHLGHSVGQVEGLFDVHTGQDTVDRAQVRGMGVAVDEQRQAMTPAEVGVLVQQLSVGGVTVVSVGDECGASTQVGADPLEDGRFRDRPEAVRGAVPERGGSQWVPLTSWVAFEAAPSRPR